MVLRYKFYKEEEQDGCKDEEMVCRKPNVRETEAEPVKESCTYSVFLAVRGWGVEYLRTDGLRALTLDDERCNTCSNTVDVRYAQSSASSTSSF